MTARRAALILGAGALATLALLPIDRAAMTMLGPFGGLAQNLGGDVRRELEFLQQFGAITSMAIVGVVIWVLDPARRAHVVDLFAAIALNAVLCNALKIFFGRPRPRVVLGGNVHEGYESATRLAFSWNEYPLPRDGGYLWARSFEVWRGISSDLWSLPSSHAAAAACAAAALSRLYPRLAPLVVVLAAITVCARVILGAHYPSDVVAGACIGWVIGAVMMERRWMSRKLGSPAS